MKRTYPLFPWYFGVLAALLSSALVVWGPAWGGVSEPPKVQLQEAYGKLPLHFIHNQGQVDARVQFYTQGGGGAFFFTREGVALSLEGDRDKTNVTRPGKDLLRQRTPLPRQGPRTVVQLQPVGMRPGVELAGADPQKGRVNYFLGNDPKKWRTNLSTYGAVVYREAYPGIDLKFYGNGRQLEYDLIVRPGADPSLVKFRYQGIEALTVTPEGDLAIRLPDGGSLTQKKPVVYQEIAGRRVAREGKFKILDHAADTYGFEVAAYDPQHPLVIDPSLVYSTYLGGSFINEGSFNPGYDVGWGIAVGGDGCAYVTGYTYAVDFPLEPSGNKRIEPGTKSAIFVTKVNENGTELVYSTILGGGTLVDRQIEDPDNPGHLIWVDDYYDDNYGYAIAVDDLKCAYVTGGATKANFPTTGNKIQGFGGGSWDAVVFKLSADGSSLIFSTFLGGSGLDIGRGIAVYTEDVDGQQINHAYVTGKTFSSDFPKQNPSQGNSGGGGDGFVSKLSYKNSDNTLSLAYSTYLGGSGDDAGNGIAVDASGNAYVAGATNSRNFPTTFKPGGSGSNDAFVTKFNADGAQQYSVRLGGTKYDSGEAVAVDGSGNAYVTGYTYSGTGFPTGAAATQATGVSTKASSKGKGGDSPTGTDVFVTKINPGGTALGYSVRLGGSNYDYGYGIAVDGDGCAYVTGETSSTDFPLADPIAGQKSGGRDVFVTKLNAGGTDALYSTYLQGNSDEAGFAIAVDDGGNAYITGYTYSNDFHTDGSYQTDNKGIYDAFVAKIGGP